MSKKEKKEDIKISELKPYFAYYKKFTWKLIPFFLLSLITIATGIIIPIYTGNLIASFTTDLQYDVVMKYALIVLGLGIVELIIQVVLRIMSTYIIEKCNFIMTMDLIKHYNTIQIQSYDKNSSYKMISRMFSDINQISNLPLNLFNEILTTTSQIGFFTYLFALNYKVGLIMILLSLFIIILHSIYVKYTNKVRYKLYEDRERENNMRLENIIGIRDIKALNISDNVYSHIEKESYINNKKRIKDYNKRDSLGGGLEIIVDIIKFISLWLLILLVTKGDISIATMIIAYNYRNNISNFSYRITYMKEYLLKSASSAKRINEFYKNDNYPLEKFGDKTMENPKGTVEFKHVNFAYTDGVSVLNDLSFKVEANTVTSFVGKSGAGKSTIISLLDKLYYLDESDKCGKILIDDININDLTCDSLRNNVTIVSQSPYLFNLTLAQNLRLVKPDATDDELFDVLKQSEMYDFIMSQPDKLNTVLGENGIILSGGQKQRLAIARAILKKSKIMVFDESTSSLDNENQAKIKDVIHNLKKDHTIIMIAHRLSTVVDSDNIFFLENGCVKASGTHSYLMKNCKDYKDLYGEEEAAKNVSDAE